MAIGIGAFSQAANALHEASADPTQWPRALHAIMQVLGADKGALFDFPAGSEEVTGLLAAGHDPAMTREYMAHYYAVDPTIRIALASRSAVTAPSYEYFSSAERKRHEYFDFARRANIGDAIAVFSGPQKEARSMLSLQRPHDAHAFDTESKRLIDALEPHLRTAKRIERLLADAAEQRAVLAAGLDRFSAAAIIVDAGGGIRHLNGAARRLLSLDPLLRARGGRLSLNGGPLDSRLQAAIRAATAAEARSSIMALPGQAGDIAELAVSPLQASHELCAPWQMPLALVVISGPPRDAEGMARRAQILYGATLAEARVMAALALGQSVEEIALGHEVKVSTVRAQIKSLFEKTKANRQTDLVRLALGGAPLAP